MAQAINDELYNYEDELWDPSDEEAWVSHFFLFLHPVLVFSLLTFKLWTCFSVDFCPV